MLTPVLLPALIAAVVLRRAFRPIPPSLVEEWAAAHALALTSRNRPMVDYYLSTARKLRTLGVLAGIVVPVAIGAALDVGDSYPFLLMLVGYLVGAVYAELTLGRPLGRQRAASLMPRRLVDYLPRRLLLAQRVVAGLCLVGGLLTVLLPLDDTVASPAISPTAAMVVALAAVAAATALEVVERFIVSRPQPVVEPDLLRADDAIRAQSIHSVSGSGVGILLMLLAGNCAAVAHAEALSAVSTLLVASAILVLPLGALFSVLYYGHRAWRVRRPAPVEAPA